MAGFFQALGDVAPYVAIVLIVAFSFMQIFGFKPIEIARNHGILVALSVIGGVVLVAIVALLVRQPEPKTSYIGEGATIGQLVEINASDPDNSFSIIPDSDMVNSFKVSVRHAATNDKELILKICDYYKSLECLEDETLGTIRVSCVDECAVD